MTVGTVSPSKGATISIGTTASDPSGDTFNEIGLVTNIGAIGKAYTDIKFMPLKGTGQETVLGGLKVDNVTVQLGKDLRDSGQDAVSDAAGVNTYYNFKITSNDAAASGSPAPTAGSHAFKAKVVSFVTNYGDEGQVMSATLVLGLKSSSYAETAPTP